MDARDERTLGFGEGALDRAVYLILSESVLVGFVVLFRCVVFTLK
jgi:hypothetical protein